MRIYSVSLTYNERGQRVNVLKDGRRMIGRRSVVNLSSSVCRNRRGTTGTVRGCSREQQTEGNPLHRRSCEEGGG